MTRLFSDIWEGFLMALRAIKSRKLRSVLTTLGIVIGVVSVTLMATVVNGLEKGFQDGMNSLGTDILYVEKWPWGFTSDWWNYINRPNMERELADVISARADHAVATTAVVMTNGPVAYESEVLPSVEIVGADGDYSLVHQVDMDDGVLFSDFEDRSARFVCVIGSEIASRLFPVQNPIGKNIRVDGRRFRVIGVMAEAGTAAGGGPETHDNQVKIPYTVFKSMYGTRYRNVSVRVRIADPDQLDAAKDELTGILRVARRLDAKEADDFEINEQATLREQFAPIKAIIYSVGIGLTALALLVGGIGVMNIMFVSVKERTREIGVRKAIGATRSNILVQFLIEAVIICLIGGAIGLCIAVPLSLLINTVMPTSVDFVVIGWAIVLCSLIGIIFGLAPAWSAAKEEPIVALRYE